MMKFSNTLFSIIIILFFTTTTSFSLNTRRLPITKKEYRKAKGSFFLVVVKRRFKLFVIHKRTKRIIRSFSIGLGLKAGRKTISGDKKTPEGVYYIHRILSKAAPKDTYAYKHLKKLNNIYWKAKKGFYRYGKPWKDLGKNAYGPRFYRLDYPTKKDWRRFKRLKKLKRIPKKAKIGYGIAIHGTNDPPSVGHRASSGCVRMYNSDVLKLEKYVRLGTLVLIIK